MIQPWPHAVPRLLLCGKERRFFVIKGAYRPLLVVHFESCDRIMCMSKPVMSSLFFASGRRNRKSYLIFLLFLLLCYAGMKALVSVNHGPIVVSVILIISMATLISQLFVTARRCRDFGWSGWSVLITLILFVSVIFSFAILFVPGTNGDNRYGPSPLEA